MRRRTLLAAIGGGTLSLAGCLSGGSDGSGTDTPDPTDSPDPDDPGGSDVPRYEECPREVIPHEQFPGEIRDEIDAALGGSHTADRIHLGDAMDVDRSYVELDDTYYDPSIESDGAGETLRLRAVEPKSLPEPRPVSVENARDGERTVTLEAVADDGTELFAETRTLYTGSSIEYGRIARAGTHELRITVADGESVEAETTVTADIDEYHFDVVVVVDPEEIYVTGAVAELVECRFGSPPTPTPDG